MVHANVETGSWNATPKILKDVTRNFLSTERIWQKKLRRTNMIGRSHRRQEQDLKSLAMLTLRRPNPCYTPTLDATIVSCHLFVVFPIATIKSVFSKLLFVLCASLSLDLSYLTPKPMDPIEDEWR